MQRFFKHALLLLLFLLFFGCGRIGYEDDPYYFIDFPSDGDDSADVETDSNGGTVSDVDSDIEIDSDTHADTDCDTTEDTDSHVDTGMDSNVNDDTATVFDSDTSRVDSDSDTDTAGLDTAWDTVTETGFNPDTDSDTGTGVAVDTDTATGTEPDTDTFAGTDSDTDSDTGTGTDTAPQQAHVTSGIWQGYAWADIGTAQGGTITPLEGAYDLSTDSICVNGTLVQDYNSIGLVGFNVDQDLDTKVASPWYPGGTYTGMIVDINQASSETLRVEFRDENDVSYCYEFTSGAITLPWGSFRQNCWMGGGAAYNGSTGIIMVQVYAVGVLDRQVFFDYCINDLSPSP
ncbi:MAG: hypothetical protein JXR76_03250 [Deltaproteobacteria bacterium]|nr:hypothetical protein [Deltaproteobacteria bacterium]